MYEFDYHRPGNLADAAKLMEDAEDATLMAGGMTLIPTLKQRLASPSDVVDISQLNSGIEVSGDAVIIGAGTTHAQVAGHDGVAKAIPALAKLAGGIGDPHVRHKGTIGGSIANNDPAADYPAGLMALNATITTSTRTLPADAFFTGMFETALEPGEIVTSVSFPIPTRAAYSKFPNPASRYAMVGVFVAEHGSGAVRVAVTGAGPGVFRHSAMETALAGDFSAEAIEGIETPADDLNEDIHATPEYRAHLVGVMAKRAVTAAG